MTDEFLIQIQPNVQQLNNEVVQKQLKYAPVWIQKQIINIIKEQNKSRII